MKSIRIVYLLLAAIVVVGVVVQNSTIGQFMVDMRAPVNVMPMGGVSTVYYGSKNVFRPQTRYLPSERRYLKSAWGLLPSEDRFRRRTYGQLPSSGRYAYLQSYYPAMPAGQSLSLQTQQTLGSIRYHSRPAGPAAPTAPTISSTQRVLGPSPLTMPGSIKYGLSGTNLIHRPTSTTTVRTRAPSLAPLSQPAGMLSPPARPTSRSYRMTSPDWMGGSLRYGAAIK